MLVSNGLAMLLPETDDLRAGMWIGLGFRL